MEKMKIIEAELAELRKTCDNSVPDGKLVTCVPSSIRVEIKKSNFKRVTICLTYPQNYPNHNILIELKSRTLSTKLLDGLVKVSENEAKKYIGKPHCLQIIKFINQFFEDNPLVCCSEEISRCKSLLTDEDKLKLSQKNSSLSLIISKDQYYLKVKIVIPHLYPEKQISFESFDSNFPRVFKIWFIEQAKEISRKCVEPPLKPKPKAPPFEPKPSLEQAVSFLVKYVKRYPDEICQICRRKCFPADPEKAIHNENAAAHVERVYCSHCYHHDCLILYMKTPPFEGGKKCKACAQRIYHEKWKVTPELAEARWAHEQAKERELAEAVDFFGDLAIQNQKS